MDRGCSASGVKKVLPRLSTYPHIHQRREQRYAEEVRVAGRVYREGGELFMIIKAFLIKSIQKSFFPWVRRKWGG